MRKVAIAVLVALAMSCHSNGASDQSSDGLPTGPSSTSPSPEVVSTSPPPTVVKVPDVIGLPLATARTRVQNAGLSIVIEEKYSKATEGVVLSTSSAPGTKLSEGSTLRIVVAKSFPRIPNVVGLKLNSARRTLEDRGFKVDVKKQSSSQPTDTVISQSPAGGTEARPGRTVTIVLAKPAPSGGGGGSNCTPGYSPCLPLGPSDYDCAGGSGDGPAYTEPGVTYHVTGSDPYGLDADNDGSGCE
jgi:resuscitation-promoting factor RpfB